MADGGRTAALTLFAGAGGADLGMRRAGVEHIACVEGDATACATLVAAGFPAVHAWIGTPPPGSDVPAWTWDGSPVDLLWASPPCQPYSAAGKMLGADDPRDGWPATLATIRRVRPTWVIIENVGGAPIEEWAAELRGSMFRPGLYPHVATRFLDAADWGLPSHRRREFLVAGPVPYRWPEPTHAGPGAPVEARRRLLPWVGMGEALNLPLDARYHPMGTTSQFTPPEGFPTTEPAGCMTTKGNQYLRLPAAGVCTTEEKGTRASAASGFTFNGGPDRASDSLFLATGRRRLTWQESAKLVGFPDDYPFQGTIGAKYRQVGNAVAPVMAEVLARQVMASEAA